MVELVPQSAVRFPDPTGRAQEAVRTRQPNSSTGGVDSRPVCTANIARRSNGRSGHNRLAAPRPRLVSCSPGIPPEAEYEAGVWQCSESVVKSWRCSIASTEYAHSEQCARTAGRREELQQHFQHSLRPGRSHCRGTGHSSRPAERKLKTRLLGEDRFEIEYGHGDGHGSTRNITTCSRELNRLAETQTLVDLFSAAEGVLSGDGAVALDEIKNCSRPQPRVCSARGA